jgi:hypothetical protein
MPDTRAIDSEVCPDTTSDEYDRTHIWCTRSYEPREHCSCCGTLRVPDPDRPSRHPRQPIAIADLAQELGMSVQAVARLVSSECHEHGHAGVVHTAASSNGKTLLHAAAADRIRARVTRRAGTRH